jgi:hypothetical protein
MRKVVIAISCCVLFGAAVFAQEPTRHTVVTLNEPVIVAGVPTVTLQPGKYVIRILNHDHSRNIVQIFNERQDKLFTTVLAIANYRLVPKENTVFRFWETPAGNPIALRAWFAAGDNWGQEFVYPKGLAAKIARETGEKVLATPAETEVELATAPVTEVTKEGEEQPLEEAYTPPAPEPAPAVVAEVAPEPAAAPEPAPEPLPATGTPLPALALIGVLTALTGAGLRKLALRKS